MANTNPTNSMRFRAKIILTAVFMVLFGAVAVNFFRISVLQNRKYQVMANDQHFTSLSISAHRGSIYDSSGKPLAKSASVYKVYLDPKRFREDMKELQKRIEKRTEEKAKGTYVPKYDADGNEIGVLPASVESFKEEMTSLLCQKLGIKADKVNEAMEKDSQYFELQKQVEKPVADEILEYFDKYGLICVNVAEDTKRYYPQSELASAVIGFTKADGTGIYGLEAEYEEYLAGIDGKTISAKDSNGNELPYKYSKTYSAKNGDDLYLTIDSDIQYILEKNLEKMVNDFDVKNRGCAIMMNCKTGQIYGMAQYPTFDLNEPRAISDKVVAEEIKKITDEAEAERRTIVEQETQWRNKCVTERYEPGSVFKVLTSAAAIEENLIDFDKKEFICTGSKKVDGQIQPIGCHIRDQGGHGAQTFQEALTNSCNPAFIDIAYKLGEEKFVYYCEAFGIGEKTGIDLPAESRGDPFTLDTIDNVDLAYGSFGQGETVTPIEMITAYCAAVNGGYLLQPYIVEKIVDSDGNIVKKNERTVRRQVISEDTSKKLRSCLKQVVLDNKRSNVFITGYSFGGKSGTSQRKMITAQGQQVDLTKEEDDTKEEYAASYICFTPAEDPEIVLMVMADMPDKSGDNYYGSRVAVPTATSIMEEVLQKLNITPEYSEEELKNLDVKIPLLEGSIDDAKATVEALELKYEVVGSGIEVMSQYPLTGTSMAKGGTVYLFTEKGVETEFVTVPSFAYMDLSNANLQAEWSGVNIATSGAVSAGQGAFVETQDPPAGTMVQKGSVVKLTFKMPDSNFTD